jgi:predicted ATPase
VAERIRAARYADNVVDLLIAKLRRFDTEAQEAVGLAACVGDVSTLAVLRGQPEEEAHRHLGELVLEGLLDRADGAYRFVHDRVRQAAYAIIPEGRRSELHAKIGRRLLERASAEEIDKRIFDIVAQLELGASLVATREERTQVTELHLRAARRAKATVAYRSAVGYLRAGAALLDRDPWEGQRDLAFALHLELAECHFLAGHHRGEGRRGDRDHARVRMFGSDMDPHPSAPEVESGFQ